MAIVVSVVGIKPEKYADVKKFLSEIEGVEIYGASLDKARVIILTDTDDKNLQDICDKINKHEYVYDVLQHSFYFDDEGESDTNLPIT